MSVSDADMAKARKSYMRGGNPIALLSGVGEHGIALPLGGSGVAVIGCSNAWIGKLDRGHVDDIAPDK